jgi:nitric oxide dioxygenase
VTSKVISKGEHNELTLFCMAKQTDISEHTSTKEGFVYVIEGDGVFNLEGEDVDMKLGVIIRLAKNAKHSLKALRHILFALFERVIRIKF